MNDLIQKANILNRSVIFKFDNNEQAQKFFGAFSDRNIEDADKAEEIKNAVNSLMGYCDINSLYTKVEDGAFFVKTH